MVIELLYRFMIEFIDIVMDYKDLEAYINNIDFSKTFNVDDYVAFWDFVNKYAKKLTLFD